MRVLGLDLGNRTLGMAISDFLGILANPIGTFRFEDQDLDSALEETKRVIKENQVEKIVLGFPKNMNGTIGPQAEYCLKFKEMLEEATALEVIMIDERLTSKQADVIMLAADMSRKKRKKNVDKLAATIILQTYLDTKK
ncbi:MAG: Holliday junction resolvase RuvX [Coprobacillus sp.]|nr:Holliday junction resolvase RuvX [Coprobacillus sp.]MDY4145835.1 Holliday junction resolvase RuvX [Bacilli bacterium]CCY08021.1 putative Holliday junction resolvase [Coprobacillus sp. CAG:698]